MKTPYAFLRFAAKVAMSSLGLGIAADLVADILPSVVEDVRRLLGLSPTDSEDATEPTVLIAQSLASPQVQTRLRETLESLAKEPPESLRPMIKDVTKEVAKGRPKEERQAVANYLAKVHRGLRKAWQREEDPTGTTFPPHFRIETPEALMKLLPKPHESTPAAEKMGKDELGIALTVVAGVHRGKSFSFKGHDTFLIGRSNQCHFRLPKDDRFFSRVHFMVELNPPRCCLMDMGSRNGTFVNGKRVRAVVELKDRDMIKAGKTLIRVRIQDEPASEKPTKPLPALPAKPRPVADTIAYSGPSISEVALFLQHGVCPACQSMPITAGSVCSPCLERSRRAAPFIPGFRFLREIGKGGMGVVSLALREPKNELTAVKTIQPAQSGSSALVERFLREARILEQLDHPNIVAFRSMGQHDHLFYFAMDYVPGADAAKVVKKTGPMSIERGVKVVSQLLRALEYAHAKGFVHRDIKPGNLLIERKPEGFEHARLADFGLARVYERSTLSGLTLQGETAGTYAFMAPEQITRFRESKPSVDLYAAAGTLYYLLTGKHIFEMPKDVGKRVQMILNEKPTPIERYRPEIPMALAHVIHGALAKDPNDRLPDAAALRRAIEVAAK